MRSVKSPCYCESLRGGVLQRYQQKIQCVGVCPYEIPKNECSVEPKDFPCLNLWAIGWFLVFTVSAFTNDQFNNYKSMNAYKMFHCGWVQELNVKRFSSLTAVIGLVNHSQKVGQKPVKAWIIAAHSGTIQTAHCTCEAGLGESCSHISALLFYVEFKVSALQDDSPTDSKCKWSEPKKVPIVKMDSLQNIDFETPKSKMKKARSDKECPQRKRPFYDVEEGTSEDKESFMEILKKISGKKTLQPISTVTISKVYSPTDIFSLYPVSMRHLFRENYLDKDLDFLLEKASDLNMDISTGRL